MLEFTREPDFLVIKAGMKLSSFDYDRFVRVFERPVADEPGRLPIPGDLAPHFVGRNPAALWREVWIDVKHKDRFVPTAVVGDNKPEEWGAKLSGRTFASSAIRSFEEVIVAQPRNSLVAGQVNRNER